MKSPSTSAARRGGSPPRPVELLQHPERLRTLRDAALLDGTPDASFDRLARVAARALHAPVALIGFVEGERCVLQGQQGLPQPWAGYRQPPLPAALARYIVLSAQPLMVDDLRRHPLTREDPVVASAGLIAYLGVPVRDGAGNVLGALCVLDCAPRRWSEEEGRALQEVAECIVAEIELRLRNPDHAPAGRGPSGGERAPAEALDPLPFEDSPVPMLMLAADTHEVLRVNPAARSHGYSAEALSAPTSRRDTERIKEELISVVSHELRTPLTAMRGSLGLLAAGRFGELDAQGQRMVEIALTNAERLSRLVHDILDLERISLGRMDLVRRAVNAAELMEAAAAVVRPAAERADVHLHVEPLTAELVVDRDRILKVLTNLLDNAVKFSGAGGSVWVRADEEGDEVVFSVRDEGRGIPEHQRGDVFECFRQGDSSDSRRKGGMGLGLALCRGLVEAHGGRIWVEGETGRGADFRFALPRTARSPG